MAPPLPPAAFADLYHEHFDFTFRTLQHLGVPAAALPDAVQEVWLAVHRRLSTFEGRSSHRTWLFSIALNTARNQQRMTRRRAAAPLPDEVVDHCPGPERLHLLALLAPSAPATTRRRTQPSIGCSRWR